MGVTDVTLDHVNTDGIQFIRECTLNVLGKDICKPRGNCTRSHPHKLNLPLQESFHMWLHCSMDLE